MEMGFVPGTKAVDGEEAGGSKKGWTCRTLHTE